MSIWTRLAPLAVALNAACATANVAPALPAPRPSPRTTVTDGMVAIGANLSLHIHCVGVGAPTVVLDAGLGGDGSVWNEVLPEVGRLTRACAYDRAGMGYSHGAPPRPHTNRQMARELHSLLEIAGLEGPYVLVGHSMGGINVRLFASEHESDVAGMVLVDATVDPLRTWSLMPEAELAAARAGMLKLHEGLDFDTFVAGAVEMRTSSRSLGDKPLVVLTRGKDDAPPSTSPELAATMLRVWQELQSELPKLSTNSAHVVAPNSRHFIQWDAPKLVVGAIHEVVTASRMHSRVNGSLLTALASDDSAPGGARR